LECDVTQGGLIILPILSRKAPRRSIENCRKTILNPIDYHTITEWLETSSDAEKLHENARTILQAKAAESRLIAWGAKPGTINSGGSFQSTLDHECAKKIIQEFTLTGGAPDDWHITLYTNRKLVCITPLTGAIESKDLANLLWNDPEKTYVFLGERNGCNELDHKCRAIETAGIDFKTISNTLGWSIEYPRGALARPGLQKHLKITP